MTTKIEKGFSTTLVVRVPRSVRYSRTLDYAPSAVSVASSPLSEANEDIAAGRVTRHDSDESFLSSLRSRL